MRLKISRISYLIALLLILAPPHARGEEQAEEARQQIKRIQIDNLTRKARRKIARAQERLAEFLATGKAPPRKGPHLPPKDLRSTLPAGEGLEMWLFTDAANQVRTGPESPDIRLAGSNANVRVNDRSGDDFDASQNEPAVAVLGADMVVAWNDWPSVTYLGSLQGYSYSTDGGQTFVDGGVVPSPPGTQWHSDPVLTVNEKTGYFFYCGLLENDGGATDMNGLGVMRGRFSGNTLVWETPRTVRYVPDAQAFIDKPWMVADSVSGNLYLTYSVFTSTSNEVVFQRSTNEGVSWGPVLTLNRPAAAGLVQGSRPAVGPNGQLYTIWKEIGTTDADFMRLRRSLNGGLTFEPERTVVGLYDNFGTGAPGFNRERGIAFPSIAVDRTFGPQRGRLYVTWNESLNWLDDPPALGTARNETENNHFFARANPFVIGENLNGSFSSLSDDDTYAFQAIEGMSYIFWCDNAPSSLYRMLVFCSDTVTKLTFTGHLDSPVDPANNQSIMLWTAPANGVYYLTMDIVSAPTSAAGPYRIRTGTATAGSERGRDQRDIFVASSPDGSTWGSPVRVNFDPPRFDNWLPEIGVSGDGNLYTIWYDWHDSPASTCGGMSHLYAARSDNFGATWVTLGAITDVQSDWTQVNSNLAPNQGDYLALTANEAAAYLVWTDGRGGSPDIFAAVLPLLPESLQVTASATVGVGQVSLTWQLRNATSLNATVYRREGGTQLDLGPVQSAGPGSLTFVDNTVSSGSIYVYGLRVVVAGSNEQIGEIPVSVPAGRLQARPNPVASSTRIRYDVAAAGEEVELRVHDVTGRKVRLLARGFQTGGPHEVLWDRLDDHGRVVPPGIYLIRLNHSGEHTSTRVAVIP